MGRNKKEQKSGGRLTKKQIIQRLLDLFASEPEREFSVKEIFDFIHAANHPAKMLTMDALSELVLDDYLTSDNKGNYRNAVRSNVMEGTFHRKRNGRNSFLPDDGGNQGQC